MDTQTQLTTPNLTNSEVAIIRKALDLFDSESLGFERAVTDILEKLKQEKTKQTTFV